MEEPHWSVISAEQFKRDRLDAHCGEFRASGRGDVEVPLAFLARNGVDPARLHSVLEYGCGLGRVTRHLAERFARVVACDISPSHLQQTEAYRRNGGLHNVTCQRIRTLADIAGPADLGSRGRLDGPSARRDLEHFPPATALTCRAAARMYRLP
ncbi:MAG: class I SAM-dependent methyltransferase [Rubrivivax sp.]|nr:class I SAM-dependent methyltransferase [Rubrivivax sp.]